MSQFMPSKQVEKKVVANNMESWTYDYVYVISIDKSYSGTSPLSYPTVVGFSINVLLMPGTTRDRANGLYDPV